MSYNTFAEKQIEKFTTDTGEVQVNLANLERAVEILKNDLRDIH